MNNNGQPSKKTSFFGESTISKHVATTIFIACIAFILASMMHGASGADRSGEGMVVIGLTIIGAPTVAIGGSLAFIFRRTIISDICGGAVLFVTVFFGTLYLFG